MSPDTGALQAVRPADVGRATAQVYVGARHAGAYLVPLPRPLGDELWFCGHGEGGVHAEVRLGDGGVRLVFACGDDLGRAAAALAAVGLAAFRLEESAR